PSDLRGVDFEEEVFPRRHVVEAQRAEDGRVVVETVIRPRLVQVWYRGVTEPAALVTRVDHAPGDRLHRRRRLKRPRVKLDDDTFVAMRLEPRAHPVEHFSLVTLDVDERERDVADP